MGKKSKSARSDAKRAERHAAKAARTALYASQAKSNKKQTSSSDGTAKSFTSHAISNCGNPGCKRCYPLLIPGGRPPPNSAPRQFPTAK
jgi:hypothetical protein